MGTDEETAARINREYEDIRTRQSAGRRKRIEEVYAAVPRVKEIDDEIREIGYTTTSAIISRSADAASLRENMKKRFGQLNAEKSELMKSHGFPEDYTKLRYDCPLCEDTGEIDGKRCSCYEQKLINAAYNSSNMSELIKKQSFSDFSFGYYSDEFIPEENSSPLNRIKSIYKMAKDFAENIDTAEKSLLFYGRSGLGKTFLSSCVAKEVLDRGKTVVYTSASRLFSVYEDIKFNRRENGEFIEKAFDCDLLIIDDLGTEAVTKMTVAFLFDLFNTRLLRGGKFIISTNLDMKGLSDLYNERFTSRIYEYFMPLKFLGSDIRVQKMGIYSQ